MGLRTNFLIQIGLALVEVQSGAVLARFLSYVAQPEGTCWEERCVNEFWSKRPALFEKAKRGIASAPPADEVARLLVEWVRNVVADPDHTRLVTDTPGFDLAWLDWLLGSFNHSYLVGGKYIDVLDVGSWYLGLGGDCDPDASSEKAALRALDIKEFPKFEYEHTHDAADDAASIVLRAAFVMRALQGQTVSAQA